MRCLKKARVEWGRIIKEASFGAGTISLDYSKDGYIASDRMGSTISPRLADKITGVERGIEFEEKLGL